MLSMRKGTSAYYYHADGLGSTGAITDQTAALVERYRYDVFGAPQFRNAAGIVTTGSAIGNRYLFIGREYEPELKTYHYRARMYHPSLGRFLQRDPIGFADDFNPYRYVKNNPGTFVDPMGLCGEKAGEFVDNSLNELESFSTALMMTNPIPDMPPFGFADQGLGLMGLGTVKTAKYWQYFTKGWTKFKSPWFVKGVNGKPPYKLGKEAREALNLPKPNKGNAVQPYKPNKIVGPRTPKPKPEWNWPKPGKGKEYFDGDAFPD